MKNKNGNQSSNIDKGINLTSRNRFNRRIFNKLIQNKELLEETGLLFRASQLLTSQLGDANWLPVATDILERGEEESESDFEERLRASSTPTIVNRVVMPMDSSKTAQTLHTLAVRDSRDKLGSYEYPSIGTKISIEEEISDKLEERIDRSIFLDVEDLSNNNSYRVPFNLITIGGAGGLGKTGIDIKLTAVVAIANMMDMLDIAKRLLDKTLDVEDTPIYFIHRLNRLMDISREIQGVIDIDISKMDSLLLYLLSQSSYVHLEEPSKDAENIAIPKSKGKKILMPFVSSSLAGTTIDSLTSIFFAVSGGAMQGGWNPSEAKALLAKLDKFSSRFSHPIISVINYLKFNAEGQKGITSICQSMSSMHIDLGSRRILLRTETDKRPPVSGNLLIKGISIRTLDRDLVSINDVDDFAEKSIEGVDYVQLDLIHDNINNQLSNIAGCEVILHESISIDNPDRKLSNLVEHPLVIVLDHKRATESDSLVEDEIKHIDTEDSFIHNNGDEDVRIIGRPVNSVIKKDSIGESQVVPFLSTLYLRDNDRDSIKKTDIKESEGLNKLSKSEKEAAVGIVKWKLLSDKQLIVRAAAVVDLAMLNEYGNEEINKAKLIYKECLEEYLDRGYSVTEFEESVSAIHSNEI